MILTTLLAATFLQLEPTEAELLDREGEEDVIPIYFRGQWAPTQSDCRDPDAKLIIQVGRTRIEAYESNHKLLKSGGVWSSTAPNGKPSRYVELLLASAGEGRVSFGTLVLSRVGNIFYTRAKETSEDPRDAKQYEFPHVRCGSDGLKR